MEAACGDEADEARARGDAYFHIPALQRHRGAAHYYFERHRGVSLDQGREDARRFGEAAVDTYVSLLRAHMLDASGALRSPVDASDASALQQRAYHTLYLYQVLTLDRGTTSGVLVHDQNDEGILGSLPPVVDVALLRTWRAMTPAPQDKPSIRFGGPWRRTCGCRRRDPEAIPRGCAPLRILRASSCRRGIPRARWPRSATPTDRHRLLERFAG